MGKTAEAFQKLSKLIGKGKTAAMEAAEKISKEADEKLLLHREKRLKEIADEQKLAEDIKSAQKERQAIKQLENEPVEIDPQEILKKRLEREALSEHEKDIVNEQRKRVLSDMLNKLNIKSPELEEEYLPTNIVDIIKRSSLKPSPIESAESLTNLARRKPLPREFFPETFPYQSFEPAEDVLSPMSREQLQKVKSADIGEKTDVIPNPEETIKKNIENLFHTPSTAEEFHKAVSNASLARPDVAENVTKYSPEEYSNMKTFLSPDKKSGFAIKPDGELVSVFSAEKGLNRGDTIVKEAIQQGASSLGAFDPYLPKLYEKHGFKEYKREPNYTPGGPDVVYMRIPKLSAPEVIEGIPSESEKFAATKSLFKNKK